MNRRVLVCVLLLFSLSISSATNKYAIGVVRDLTTANSFDMLSYDLTEVKSISASLPQETAQYAYSERGVLTRLVSGTPNALVQEVQLSDLAETTILDPATDPSSSHFCTGNIANRIWGVLQEDSNTLTVFEAEEGSVTGSLTMDGYDSSASTQCSAIELSDTYLFVAAQSSADSTPVVLVFRHQSESMVFESLSTVIISNLASDCGEVHAVHVSEKTDGDLFFSGVCSDPSTPTARNAFHVTVDPSTFEARDGTWWTVTLDGTAASYHIYPGRDDENTLNFVGHINSELHLAVDQIPYQETTIYSTVTLDVSTTIVDTVLIPLPRSFTVSPDRFHSLDIELTLDSSDYYCLESDLFNIYVNDSSTLYPVTPDTDGVFFSPLLPARVGMRLGVFIDIDNRLSEQGLDLEDYYNVPLYSAPYIAELYPTSLSTVPDQILQITVTNLAGSARDLQVIVEDHGYCEAPYADGELVFCFTPAGFGVSSNVTLAVTADDGVVLWTETHENTEIDWEPPQIDSVSPTYVATQPFFTSLTLRGSNFGPITSEVIIHVGNFTCEPDTDDGDTHTHSLLTCDFPSGAGADNPVYVEVDGIQSETAAETVSYKTPRIVMVSPATGPISGETITLAGENFGPDTALIEVFVGEYACTDIAFDMEHRQFSCVIEPGVGANLDVNISVANQTYVLESRFTFEAPIVTDVSPQTSPTLNTIPITIQGSNFGHRLEDIEVMIGDYNCTNGTFISSTEYTCTPDPGAGGDLPIILYAGGQASNSDILFSYDLPTIDTVVVSGPKYTHGYGTNITITGTNLGPADSVLEAYVGDFPADSDSFIRNDDHTEVLFVLPEGVGVDLPIKLIVYNQEVTATQTFSYQAPIISSLSITEGVTSGGYNITVQGLSFGHFSDTEVSPYDAFDREFHVYFVSPLGPIFEAEVVDVTSHTSMIVEVPAGGGTNNLVQFDCHGAVNTSELDVHFNYSAPVVLTVTPDAPTEGAYEVSVQGFNFGTDDQVTFEVNFQNSEADLDIPCESPKRWSDSEITCFVPNGVGQEMETIVTILGQDPSQTCEYQYETPIVTSVNDTGCDIGLESDQDCGAILIYGDEFPPPYDHNNVPFVPKVYLGMDPVIECLDPEIKFLGLIQCVPPKATGQDLSIYIETKNHLSAASTQKYTYTSPSVDEVIFQASGASLDVEFEVRGTRMPVDAALRTVILGDSDFFCDPATVSELSCESSMCSWTCSIPSVVGGPYEISVQLGNINEPWYVSNTGMMMNSAAVFTSDAPSITGMSNLAPLSSGGDTISIYGANFGLTQDDLLDGTTYYTPAVFFGELEAASLTHVDDTTIVVESPAGVGEHQLSIVIAGQTGVFSSNFVYEEPTFSSASPSSLSSGGFEEVSLVGSGFPLCGVSCVTVFFNDAVASFARVDSSTAIVIITPEFQTFDDQTIVINLYGTNMTDTLTIPFANPSLVTTSVFPTYLTPEFISIGSDQLLSLGFYGTNLNMVSDAAFGCAWDGDTVTLSDSASGSFGPGYMAVDVTYTFTGTESTLNCEYSLGTDLETGSFSLDVKLPESEPFFTPHSPLLVGETLELAIFGPAVSDDCESIEFADSNSYVLACETLYNESSSLYYVSSSVQIPTIGSYTITVTTNSSTFTLDQQLFIVGYLTVDDYDGRFIELSVENLGAGQLMHNIELVTSPDLVLTLSHLADGAFRALTTTSIEVSSIELTMTIPSIYTDTATFENPMITAISPTMAPIDADYEAAIQGTSFPFSVADATSIYLGPTSDPIAVYQASSVSSTEIVFTFESPLLSDAALANPVIPKSQIEPGVYDLSVTSEEGVISCGTIRLFEILTVEPVLAPNDQSITITVYGGGFLVGETAYCHWLDGSTSVATVLSETELQCATPSSHDTGRANVRVSFAENDLISDVPEDVDLYFYETPTFSAFSPHVMPLSGGEALLNYSGGADSEYMTLDIVDGSNVIYSASGSSLSHNYFGVEFTVPACTSILSESRCADLPQQLTTVITYNEVTYHELPHPIFYTQPTYSSSVPDQVSPMYPIPITVRGSGFVDAQSDSLICEYNGSVSTGIYFAEDRIMCLIPRSPEVYGLVLLRVSFDGGVTYLDTKLITFIETSTEVCTDYSYTPAIRKERRAFGVETRLHNLATNGSTDLSFDISEFTYNLPWTVNDGDRCCTVTEENLGMCGLEFASHENASIVLQLPRPGYINMILSSWLNPCTQQPHSFSIEYCLRRSYPGADDWDTAKATDNEDDLSLDETGYEALTWTFLRDHYTGKGSTPFNVFPRVCSTAVSDAGNLAICVDALDEPIIADTVRVTFNNRLPDRNRAHLMEIETHGLYMHEAYRLTGDWVDTPDSSLEDDPDYVSTPHPLLRLAPNVIYTDNEVSIPEILIGFENIVNFTLTNEQSYSVELQVIFVQRDSWRPYVNESELTADEISELEREHELTEDRRTDIETELDYVTQLDEHMKDNTPAVYYSNDGSATVGLTLVAPVPTETAGINYEVFIYAPDVEIGITAPIIVLPGQPRSIEIVDFPVDVSFPTFFTVLVESMPHVYFKDASGNPADLSLADVTVTTKLYYLRNVDATEQLQSDYVEPEVEEVTDTYLPDSVLTMTTASLTGDIDYLEFNFTLVTPAMGTYWIEFEALELDCAINQSFVIGAGEPFALDIVISSVLTVEDYEVFSPAPEVLILDYLGNQVTGSNLTIQLTASSDDNHILQTEHEKRLVVAEDGSAVFSEMFVGGEHGIYFNLTATCYDCGSDLDVEDASYYNLQIEECSALTVSKAEGVGTTAVYSCVCIAGYQPVPEEDQRSAFDLCKACSPDTYKDYAGNEECLSCPDQKGTYGSAAESRDECVCKGTLLEVDDQCIDCPTGLICEDGVATGTEAGYWSSAVNSTNVYKCQSDEACTGRVLDDVDPCEEMYTGRLCSVCNEGYAKVGNDCSKCSGMPWLDILVLIGVVLVAAGLIFMLIRGSKNPRSQSSLYTRIGMNHAQVLFSIGEFGTTWPNMLQSLFGVAGAAGGSVSMPAFSCTLGFDFEAETYFYYMIPIIVIIGLGIFYAIYFACKKNTNDDDDDEPKMMYSDILGQKPSTYVKPKLHPDFVRAVLASLYTLYSIEVQKSISALHCVDIDGVSVLSMDMTIVCTSDEYTTFKYISWAALLVYGIGIPVLFLYMLIVDLKLGMKLPDGTIPPSKFLSQGYRKRMFFWEIVIILRKASISLLTVFLASDVTYQLIFGTAVIAFFLLAHAFCKPYSNNTTFTMELMSLYIMFATLLSALTMLEDEVTDYQRTVIGWLLLVANVIILVVVFGYYSGNSLKKFVNKRRQKAYKKGFVVNDETEMGQQLTEIRMVVNPLILRDLPSDSEHDDITLGNITSGVRIQRVGPIIIYFEDLKKRNMIPSGLPEDLLEDIQITFFTETLGHVDVTIEFANSIVAPREYQFAISELRARANISQYIDFEDIELLSGPFMEFVEQHFDKDIKR